MEGCSLIASKSKSGVLSISLTPLTWSEWLKEHHGESKVRVESQGCVSQVVGLLGVAFEPRASAEISFEKGMKSLSDLLATLAWAEQRFQSTYSEDRGSAYQVAPFPLTTGRMALMCSGPEAQQPPMIRAPIRFQFRANSAIREG